MRSSVPFYVPVHEMGHAIASWATRHRFDYVIVRPRQEWNTPRRDEYGNMLSCGAMVVGPRRCDPFSLDGIAIDEQDGRLLRDVLLDIVCDMAGPIAEARIRRWSLRRVFMEGGGGVDWDNAEEAASLFPLTCDPHRLINACIARARLLFRWPGIWAATLDIAKKLQRRGRLEEQEVLGLLGAHGVVRPPAQMLEWLDLENIGT